MSHVKALFFFCVAGVLVLAGPMLSLEFAFNPEPGMDQEAIDGFVAAGALWSQIFSDDVTINIDIGFRRLDPMVLGSTGSERITITYEDLVDALGTDNLSDDDDDINTALQAAPAFDLVMNRTRNSPLGSGDPGLFLDNNDNANNTTIRLSRANAKALGLLPADDPALDASISFSTEFNFDFDSADGIQANHLDFVIVAAHEIGHALGFTSGVDVLDGFSPPEGGPFDDDQFTWVSPADVFRFSTVSVNQVGNGTLDWSADARPKFFSADGGANDLAEFSQGTNFGDGRQASHWKDDRGLGIMDPTFAVGERSNITTLDTQLFDVIGWDLVSDAPLTTDLSIDSITGVTVTYSITATNLGPETVSGAVIDDNFPQALSGVTWSCVASGGGTCTPSGVGDIRDVVDLPVGATVTYTATGTASEYPGNVATIAAPMGVIDTDQSNNSFGTP